MKPLSILLTVFLLCSLGSLSAQDGHYWSENYGNRSMLLSGTVNASVEDLGAVFYNPGRLGMIKNPAFAISAKVYEWKTLKASDDTQGIKLNQSKFGGAPSLVAGTFKVPFLKNHKFAYSFLTRQRNNIDFFTRIEREGDLIEGLPGTQDIFNAKLDINTDFKEEWIGLTWAPPTSSKFGIGLSMFISTLDKSNLLGVSMNALNELNQAGFYSVNRRYDFDSYGLLWKLGMALDLETIRFGLTITTPRVNLFGNGSILIEDYLVGVDTSGDGMADDAYVFNVQDDLKTTYNTPLAIGLGMGIPFKNGLIHLSAEWYNEVPEYTILEIAPFTGQSTGETVRFAVQERLESVLNYGLGVEWYFSEKVSAYGSFAMDNSAVPSAINRLSDFGETTSNSVFQADFHHFGGGIAIDTKAVDITVGAGYKGASSTFNNQIDFPDEGGGPPEGNSQVKVAFSEWRFILGFSFSFADKLIDDLKDE